MPLRRSNPREPIIRRLILTILAVALAAAAPRLATAQQPAAPVDSAAQQSPAGTWRGSSICTPGHPACHDETVVYRIRPVGARFEISATKIVAGQEEFMGIVQCDYAADTHVLNCPSSYGVWNFTISGTGMTGTLVARGELYRRVTVSRAAS
jgi:hypothetical protein